MWPVSQLYLDTLSKPHDQFVFVEVLKDGRVITSLDSSKLVDPITGISTQAIGGSIQVDKTTIRRSGTISFLDPSGTLIPDDSADLFAPFVTEIRVWVGVKYWDDSGSEKVPVATLVITDVSGEYPLITINGYDRMWLLSKFAAPYTVAKNINYTTALATLLQANVPSSRLSLNLPIVSEDSTSLLSFDVDSEVSDAAFQLATAANLELYVDPMGTFVTHDQPTTEDPPVMSYTPGAGSVMMRPKRAISSAGEIYNAVVFTGEGGSANAVYRGYAQDNDPTSLTYVGRMGVRPYFESSPLMSSNAQCDKAALTTLHRILGIADTIIVPAIPNHALEGGDVLHIVDPVQGIDRNVILDSFSVPLRASDGVQELSCRSKVIR